MDFQSSNATIANGSSDNPDNANLEVTSSLLTLNSDTAQTSSNGEHPSDTNVGYTRPSQIEVIEIDDSDSENGVQVLPKLTPHKRRHFFSDDKNTHQTKRVYTKTNEQSTSAPDSTQHTVDYPHSDRTSAYVQHIAEACTLIMTDLRWRTCTKTFCQCRTEESAYCVCKTLLLWENGDDLSAVKAFIALYDKDGTSLQSDLDTSSKGRDEDGRAFERAMHLYSRMFHRKGPWFELADLYCRYYAPKTKANDQSEPEQAKTYQEPVIKDSSETNRQMKMTKLKKSDFFTPKSGSGGCSIAIDTPKSSAKSVLTNNFYLHQTALELLFNDIIRLLSSGLIRSFESEYECGSVAGNVSGNGRGAFLLADERREVLHRLGGGKSTKANDGDSGSNEILVQMQKQQSMFSSALLPVQKHVDFVLTRKLALKIATLASDLGPQSKPRKADVDYACQIIQRVWGKTCNALNGDCSIAFFKQVVTTVRLREAPLTTLRRVLRLFLCASGGPGNMRGDGTNGWMHIPNLTENSKIPNQWNNVVFPGLSSRLGLTSYELQQCYSKLNEDSNGRSSIDAIARVFKHYSNFRLWEIGAEMRGFVDRTIEASDMDRSNRRRHFASSADYRCEVYDQFHVLTLEGRRSLVKCIGSSCNLDIELTSRIIESDINFLYNNDEDGGDGLSNDTERMIVAISIVCNRILQARMANLTHDLDSLATRPWLRHFSFDSILVHIIWDCIPLFERNSLYAFAISFLATILLGSTHSTVELSIDKIIELVNSNRKPSVQLLLPRRNRGKAFDRLVIDLTHADRARNNKENVVANKEKAKNSIDKLTPIQQLCKSIIHATSLTGSVPFCSIRNIARRLKTPLRDTMKDVRNYEASLLNIRFDNGQVVDEPKSSIYFDWTPTTDFSVANAISNSENYTPGKRCSFVGWENESSDQDAVETIKSLTVEELALDEYNQGRLPSDKSLNKGNLNGGFVGWHCEGSHLRAIYRILCLQDLLCHRFPSDDNIFLTPYQTSPYDLHVGMQSIHNYNTNADGLPFVHAASFYERRRETIESFLKKLSQLDSQSICNCLYEAVQKRWQSHKDSAERLKDVSLQRDTAQLRSLSCVAAGLGGKLLARIFRSMCFDYRHFSGGLPDLLVVRASYKIEGDAIFSLVDLGDWIGEAFSTDKIDKGSIQRGESMLRDDEFLGCSKNGDSLQRSTSRKAPTEPITDLPPKLSLKYNGKRVDVDTILIEVKSANDRLDARQEDWLNVLDASARVCKFHNKKGESAKK